MKKLNNQYKFTAVSAIFWYHLLEWLRLLVLALARSREWAPQAVVRQACNGNNNHQFFNTKTY